MEVTTTTLRRCDVVTVAGRIDAGTVGALSEALTALKDAGRYKIVLNMKAVSFISSAGLNELIDSQKACKQLKRGELVLAEISPNIKSALELAGLTPLFKIFESELEAVGSF